MYTSIAKACEVRKTTGHAQSQDGLRAETLARLPDPTDAPDRRSAFLSVRIACNCPLCPLATSAAPQQDPSPAPGGHPSPEDAWYDFQGEGVAEAGFGALAMAEQHAVVQLVQVLQRGSPHP